MSVSYDDLKRFHAFATARLSEDGVASFEELVLLWKQEDRNKADLDSIRRGIADADVGRTSPADEAFERVRRSLSAEQ